jgi:APA family basic amino acid/polyamine antiporter
MKTTNNTPQVRRELGPFTATSVVVANMIGAGILTTTGLMAIQLPSPSWIFGCWIFGGLIAMSGALCYAELATRMPEEGGEYVYLKKLYHPAFGFLTGWTSLIVGFSVPTASSALGFTEYMFAGLDIQSASHTAFRLVQIKKMTAIGLIIFFTTIHYLGLRRGSKVQNILTAIKVLSIIGLTTVGLAIGGGNWSHLGFQTGEPLNIMAIGTAMMFVMFSYSGWNASTYVAGELRNPRKTLFVSLTAGTLIVIIIYLSVNVFIFHAVPYSELKGNIAVLEMASVKAFGEWMGNGLGILIGCALLSSLSAFILIGPRVYYAMARDGLFFSFASKVHPKHNVPSSSIVVQGMIAIMMVTIGSYEQLLIYIGFALNIFPWLAITGLFIARKRHVGDESAVKVWGYPVVPIFFLCCSLIMMIFNYVNRPVESTAAVLTVIIGIPCYYLLISKVKKSE